MKKVLVGFSGGVDSCVSALLLKQAGYEVVALTLDVTGNIPECVPNIERTMLDAKDAAEALNIEHHISTDWKKRFEECVIANFIEEYSHARTPNPCVRCNPTVKFPALFEAADKYGCDYVATGHYARISENGLIMRGISEKKDQSYMLYRLNDEMRRRIIFPLGEYEKENVRLIAKEHNLALYKKADSQENCFIPDDDHAAFIERYTGIAPKAGCFVDKSGRVLGEHKGIIKYTIGQRRGLGVAAGERIFVTHIDAENNTVVLGSNEELFSNEVKAFDVVWHTEKIRTPAFAKIRSAAKPSECVVDFEGDIMTVSFSQPVRAKTAGQSVVVYNEAGEVLGGGIIM